MLILNMTLFLFLHQRFFQLIFLITHDHFNQCEHGHKANNYCAELSKQLKGITLERDFLL